MTTPFIDFIHPEDRDTVMQEYQDRLSGKKQSAQYTIRFFTKNGEVRWVDLKSEPLQWDGKPAALALLTDITDTLPRLPEKQLGRHLVCGIR